MTASRIAERRTHRQRFAARFSAASTWSMSAAMQNGNALPQAPELVELAEQGRVRGRFVDVEQRRHATVPVKQMVGEVFPEAIRRQIVGALQPLSASNFCNQIAVEQHLDPQAAVFATLTAQQRAAIASVDRTRNVSPRVVRCVVDGATVTFDKEVAFAPGGPRQHVYGAVRFLGASYSTFQIVRAGPAPDASVLDQMTIVVTSRARY